MNRPTPNRLRSLRIERLELRHLLNADGFAFHPAHHENHEYHGRQQTPAKLHHEVSVRRQVDLSTPLQESHRNHPTSQRHHRHNRAGAIENRSPLANPIPAAALDIALTVNLQPEPEQFSEPAVRRTASTPNNQTPASRNLLFVIVLPLTLANTPTKSPDGDLVSALPPSESAVETPTGERVGESFDSSARVLANPVEASLGHAPTDRVEAMQLVSIVRQQVDPNLALIDDSADMSISNDQGPVPSIRLSFASPRLDNSSLSQWLDQQAEIEAEISELEDLLNTIAEQRSGARSGLRSNHVASRPLVRPETWSDPTEQAEHDLDEMVLLLPTSPAFNHPAPNTQQIFAAIDDVAIAQWTIEIGVHRVLDSADAIHFSREVAAAEIGIVPSEQRREERTAAATPSTQLVTTTQRAVGVAFCGLGMQFLYERRRVRTGSHPIDV